MLLTKKIKITKFKIQDNIVKAHLFITNLTKSLKNNLQYRNLCVVTVLPLP